MLAISGVFVGIGLRKLASLVVHPNFWLKPATTAATFGVTIMSIEMIILGIARL